MVARNNYSRPNMKDTVNRNSVLRKIRLVQLADIIINDLKLKRNDIVMVYSSLERINLIDSKPEDLIYLLKMLTGTGGTLLMKVSGNMNLSDVAGHKLNRSDIICELFRQTPGTILSRFEGESFAAWGKMAENLAGEHYSTGDSSGSLFSKLNILKAKIIGIGVTSDEIQISETSDDNKSQHLNEMLKAEDDRLKVFLKHGIPFFRFDPELGYNKMVHSKD